MKKIGIIGSGGVAKTLGVGFLQYGYDVMLGTSNLNKLADWQATSAPSAKVGSFQQAAAFGDILVLAVKGNIAKVVIDTIDSQDLAGKTIIDTCNPIADLPPEKGVLQFTTDLNQSLMEILQAAHPAAHFVKAFSCVGSAFMVNPSFESQPTMFICGNNDAAKKEVTDILTQFGWETADMGEAESARAIEPLCILWCIPGFRANQWRHAFKLLRA